MAFVSVVPIVVLLSVGAVILALGIAIIPIFNSVLHTELQKILPMTNSSSTLSTWEDPRDSVSMQISFYLFDLQNPLEVSQGQKPILKQMGPYVYNEFKVKKNVTFLSNNTITYIEPRTMVFNRSASVGSENDTFITLNVPVYSVISMLSGSPAAEFILNGLLETIFNKDDIIFRNISVYDILWGYKDEVMTSIVNLLKPLNISLPPPFNDGYFGFFYKKNNSDDGVYNVYNGQGSLDKMMEIHSWNGDDHIHYWKTEYCNMINGTDGTMYHPFVSKSDHLSLFSSDLCRSITVEYDHTLLLEDVPLYRFTPPSSLFAYPPGNQDNACYCVGKSCPHAGVLNISACQSGAPVFVSQPHFLNGDYYGDQVQGLSPDNALHNTFIDVESTTGVVMRGAKRLQLNVAVESDSTVNIVKKLPNLLFPLFWLDESAMINDKGMATFKQQFFNTEEWVFFAAYFTIACGAAIIICTLIYVTTKYIQQRKKVKSVPAAPVVSPDERTPLLGEKKPVKEDNDWADMMGNETYCD